MAYERLNLDDGITFNASHVKHLEDGIEAAHEAAESASGFATEQFVIDKITEAELGGGDVDLSSYAKKTELPTKTSQLDNDSGYITGYTETDPTVPSWAKQAKKPSYTAAEVGALPNTYTAPVQSVNGKTGAVSLTAEDVGAQAKGEYLTEVPAGYATEDFVKNKIAEAELAGGDVDLSGYAEKSEIPTKTSQLQNDSGFITGYTETDPTVPSWAKQAQKPTYTAAEVGALPASTTIPSALSQMSEDATHRTVTDEEKAAWNAKGEYIGIIRVESMDTENLVNLRDLETGPYLLYGYFSPYANSDMSMTFDNTIVIVARKAAGSHLFVLTGLNSKINFLEILVDESAPGGHTFTRTDFNLLEMNTLLQSVASAVRVAEIALLAANWVGDASPYSQVVTIEGITPYSQVDLKPSVEQLTIFHDKDLAFVTENEGGVVTVYAIGDKPLNDYTMQVTIREVTVYE